MIRIFCDKCGEELQEYREYTMRINGPEIRPFADNELYDFNGYHLCRACVKKVVDFIEGTKGEENNV